MAIVIMFVVVPYFSRCFGLRVQTSLVSFRVDAQEPLVTSPLREHHELLVSWVQLSHLKRYEYCHDRWKILTSEDSVIDEVLLCGSGL